MVDEHIDIQELRAQVSEELFEPVEEEQISELDTEIELQSEFAKLQETVREIESRGNLAGLGYT